MTLPRELAELQASLLAALADDAPTELVCRQAAEAALDPAVAEWVASWEPELVELAGLLVRRWARIER